MSDNSGSGTYQYLVGGVNFVKGNFLVGPFVNFTNVAVKFNGYTLTAQEYTVGPTFCNWGKIGKKFDYSFWLSPGFKIFSDHGRDANLTEEAWQKDYGFYGIGGVNITDKANRWFLNYKLQLQYQKNIWSNRTGVWHSGNNLTDSINFKAVNKAYFKTQFEVAIKKVKLGQRGRFEPKIVVAYLYDEGAQKSMLEGGVGIAIAFTKNSRYYEAFSLQYRARYGTSFDHRLDLVEVNIDFINLIKLFGKEKK